MKLNIYEFSLFLKILCFVSKVSLNIPEYRCLLIDRILYFYTIEHAVENIAYHRFQLISVTLLSLPDRLTIVKGNNSNNRFILDNLETTSIEKISALSIKCVWNSGCPK